MVGGAPKQIAAAEVVLVVVPAVFVGGSAGASARARHTSSVAPRAISRGMFVAHFPNCTMLLLCHCMITHPQAPRTLSVYCTMICLFV